MLGYHCRRLVMILAGQSKLSSKMGIGCDLSGVFKGSTLCAMYVDQFLSFGGYLQ